MKLKEGILSHRNHVNGWKLLQSFVLLSVLYSFCAWEKNITKQDFLIDKHR